MQTPGPRPLRDMLDAHATLSAVAEHLDGLSAVDRHGEARALPAPYLEALWDMASAAAALTVDDVVPAAQPPHSPVRWLGRSSLPPFRRLEMPMFRDEQGRAWGRVVAAYALMNGLLGPLYFSVNAHPDDDDEIQLDFQRVPETAPAGWPSIQPPSRASALMLQGVPDRLRRVSRGVMVGRAEATAAHALLVVTED